MAADVPGEFKLSATAVAECVRYAIKTALPGVVVDGEVDMDADLTAADLDSLAALAIMTAIEDRLGLVGQLDVTAPFRYPTPVGIVGYVHDELGRR
jgi:acyl carrier protein